MNTLTTQVRRCLRGTMVLSLMLCMYPAFGTSMVLQEYAAEIDAVHLRKAPVEGGLFYVKRCDHCPIIGVSFQPGTQFFLNNRKITTTKALKIIDGDATVFFDPNTRYVTRVMYWRATAKR